MNFQYCIFGYDDLFILIQFVDTEIYTDIQCFELNCGTLDDFHIKIVGESTNGENYKCSKVSLKILKK